MDTEQGNPVHHKETTEATDGSTTAAVPPAGPEPRLLGAKFLVVYPIAGLVIVATFLAAHGSWNLALRAGARSWVYGALVTSMACACFAGHVYGRAPRRAVLARGARFARRRAALGGDKAVLVLDLL